jgi:hypothetical protein
MRAPLSKTSPIPRVRRASGTPPGTREDPHAGLRLAIAQGGSRNCLMSVSTADAWVGWAASGMVQANVIAGGFSWTHGVQVP